LRAAQLAGRRARGRWAPNKPVEALHCYGTTSLEHPAVQMIAMERGKFYMGARAAGAGARASERPGSPVCCPALAAASVLSGRRRQPCREAHARAAGCALKQAGVLPHAGGRVQGLALPKRVFPCATPAQARASPACGPAVCLFRL